MKKVEIFPSWLDQRVNLCRKIDIEVWNRAASGMFEEVWKQADYPTATYKFMILNRLYTFEHKEK